MKWQDMNVVQRSDGCFLMNRISARAADTCIQTMQKYPQPNYVAAKLGEESGEVIGAYVKMVEGRGSREAFEEECVQAIGLIFRLMVEGDATIADNAAEVPT